LSVQCAADLTLTQQLN